MVTLGRVAGSNLRGDEMAGATKAQRVAALNRQMESVKARKDVIDAEDKLAKAKAASKAARDRSRAK